MKEKMQLFKLKGIKCNNCVNDILEDLNKIKRISHAEINNNLNEVKIISEKKFQPLNYKVILRENIWL